MTRWTRPADGLLTRWVGPNPPVDVLTELVGTVVPVVVVGRDRVDQERTLQGAGVEIAAPGAGQAATIILAPVNFPLEIVGVWAFKPAAQLTWGWGLGSNLFPTTLAGTQRSQLAPADLSSPAVPPAPAFPAERIEFGGSANLTGLGVLMPQSTDNGPNGFQRTPGLILPLGSILCIQNRTNADAMRGGVWWRRLAG